MLDPPLTFWSPPLANQRKTAPAADLRRSLRHVAARLSIVLPLVGKSRRPAALSVVRRRRARLLISLRAADWPPLRARRDMAYALNCPSVGVKKVVASRCCRRTLVCPFCHGRDRVLAPFMKLERAMYGPENAYEPAVTGHLPAPLDPTFRVLAFKVTTTGTAHLADSEPTGTPAGFRAHCDSVLRMVKNTRRKEVAHFSPVCGLVLCKVYPAADGRCLAYARGGVFLLRGGVPADKMEYYTRLGGAVREWPPTKKGLLGAFLFALKYPAGVMRADPGQLAAFLTAVRGKHLAAWYGPHAR